MTRPVLSSILVKPTSADCNLHCTYCFYHDRLSDPYRQNCGRHMMDDDTLRALIKQGLQMMAPASSFSWQGGEPLLTGIDFFQRVVDYQQYFGQRGHSVSNGVQTNGTLINEEWAKLFAQYHFLLGISLDGPKQLHDHYRVTVSGEGTYDLVNKGIRCLQRHNVDFNILSVVNRVTGEYPKDIWSYMCDQGFSFLQFIPCVERDPVTGKLTDYSVLPQQFGNFMCEIFDLWYHGGQPQVSVRLFDNLLLAFAGHGPQVCQFKRECGDYVVVEYNGDVYPCDFYVEDQLFLGNLHKQPINEIVHSPLALAFKARKLHGDPACESCRWLPICNHGCPMMRDHNPTGERTHFLCSAYQQIFQHVEDRLRKLAVRIPPLSPTSPVN